MTDVWDYREELSRLARRLCRDEHDGEDVAHSALIKAAQRMDGFRGESTVSTWLHTITLNECRMLRRRRIPLPLSDVPDIAEVDTRTDPEFVAEESELLHEVLVAVADLGEKERCVLLLREGQELSMVELSELMGISVPAVKSALYRARRSVRGAVDAGRSDELGDGRRSRQL